MDLATKSKLNYEKRDQLVDDILREVDKNGDYYNTLAISKAALLATKTVLDKEGAKGTGAKAEESLSGLPDSLVKESEADLKKEAANLKKSAEIINSNENKKEKKGSALFSKIGGALGGPAENALFSAAGKAAESLGSASPFAKKGLAALKGVIDKNGGLKEVLSKKEETKTDLNKKVTETLASAKLDGTTSLVNNVKKLNPLAKKEAPKDKEAPKAAETNTSTNLPKSPTSKSDTEKKQETQTSGNNGLGSDKDIQDIKNALTRMAGLLEGTLTVSLLDQPFRPDSRNF
jgi:hypothetical protein